jgi:competence protein ComEA
MKSLVSLLSAFLLTVSFSNITLAADPVTPSPQAQVEQQQSLININTADVSLLTQLKGIGVKKAEAIIAWRDANGKFKTLEQLLDVKGIGDAILEANRSKISI